MRDDRNYSSASMVDYIQWVCRDKLYLTKREINKHINLFILLSELEFIWNHPLDENRAKSGLELRSDFEYETGEYLDKTSGLMPKCTIFELLADLAISCENRIMYDPLIGNRTSKWFFEFLNNLDLLDGSRSDQDIRDNIQKEIAEGLAFPLKFSKNGPVREQLWTQLGSYMSENHIKNDSNLALFS